MLLKLAVLLLLPVTFIAGITSLLIWHDGMLVVDVQDRGKNTHLFLPVPMAFVNLGLSFVPRQKLQRFADSNLDGNGAPLKALAASLSRCPDAVFVEVEAPGKKLQVRKKGDAMIFDLQSADQTVYVRVPITATGEALQKISD